MDPNKLNARKNSRSRSRSPSRPSLPRSRSRSRSRSQSRSSQPEIPKRQQSLQQQRRRSLSIGKTTKICNPCCCLRLRTGCIIIGVLEALLIGAGFYMISVAVSDGAAIDFWDTTQINVMTPEDGEANAALEYCVKTLPAMWGTAYLFQGVGGVLLLVAIFRKIPVLCLVNLILTGLSLLLLLVEGILCAISAIVIYALVVSIVILPHMVYFIVCVVFYWKQLKMGRMERASIDMAPLYSTAKEEQSLRILSMPEKSEHGGGSKSRKSTRKNTKESLDREAMMAAKRKSGSIPKEDTKRDKKFGHRKSTNTKSRLSLPMEGEGGNRRGSSPHRRRSSAAKLKNSRKSVVSKKSKGRRSLSVDDSKNREKHRKSNKSNEK